MKKDKNEIKYILWGLSPLFVSIGIVLLFFLAIYIIVNFELRLNIKEISGKVEKELEESYCIDFDNDCKVIEGEKVISIFECTYFIMFETTKEELEEMVSNDNWEARKFSSEKYEIQYDDIIYVVEQEFYSLNSSEFGAKLYYCEDGDKIQCIFHGTDSHINMT